MLFLNGCRLRYVHSLDRGIRQVISAQVLSSTSLTLGWVGFVPLLLWAASRTRWLELFADSRRQHLLFGTVFCLFALWLVRRDFDTGVSYHFIGMTAVTLLLDWPLAVLGGFLAQLGLLALGRQDGREIYLWQWLMDVCFLSLIS